MEVIYRHYEPDQGLEEQQAKIFTESSGGTATADQIRERYEREKIDPKTVCYAMTGDGKMLAYIQARDYPEVKETHIGFPWALPDCPEGVQDKLFDDMLAYIRKRQETMTIRANAPASRQEIVDFFKKKGLVEKTRGYRYNINLNKASKKEYSGEFTTRIATNSDLNLLVDLIKADGRYSGQFPSDTDIVNYFKDRVLKDGHAVMVFKDKNLVMASAPLVFTIVGDDEASLILRFHSYLPGHESAYKPLITNVAKECVTTDYGTDKPLSVFIGPDDGEFARILDDYGPEKEVTIYGFGLED
ncbi:MAG: hypothetical protein ACFFD4_28770 [Candidatus Odinarchaeota archaeon]